MHDSADAQSLTEQERARLEIESLRAQLDDAEETLRAIREGAVDALVVDTPQGQRVFTLQGADQTYRHLIERMQEGAITLTTDGIIHFCNRHFADLLQLPLEQIFGTPITRYIADADQCSFEPLLSQSRTGHAWGEVHLIAADGRSVPVQIAISPLEEGIGASMSMLVFDLTERKRAEKVLASEEHYRLLFDRNPDGVFAVDATGQFILANPACEIIFGYAPDEMLQKTFLDLCAPDRLEYTRAQFEKSQAMGNYDQFETAIIRKDGRRVEVWIAGDPIFSGGKLTAIHCTAKDVTERKHAEKELLASKAAAEAANLSKTQFLANMSHELRTPMNAILGLVDVALLKATHPTVIDCLATAKGSADLLLMLLNDLLDSAKIESGKLELESAAFSLRRLLEQITSVLAVRASEKGLSFYCRMPDETPDAIVGDRMRLQQILLNLAGNAIKFTDRGDVEINLKIVEGMEFCGMGILPMGKHGQDGRATSHDSKVHTIPKIAEGSTSASESPNPSVTLEFTVRDTGLGIAPSNMELLFQPFVQANASMARRFGGTGLGLAISKSLVEMMGGRIWAESELSKGSVFSFTVSLSLPTELPPDFEAPVVVSSVAGAQLRILLVEDNPANQKLATYLLNDRGHRVEIAHDGNEAIEAAGRTCYDVILMDVQMPGMNGLEATAAIRAREQAGDRVPIIAMTAHAMHGDRERCLAVGMDGYLSKPINAVELIGLVERMAGDSNTHPPVANPAGKISGKTFPPPTDAIFSGQEAFERCCQNSEMVQEMIQCFFDDSNSLFPQMHAALENRDLIEVARLGHRIKGTLVYLGAQRACEAAARVERLEKRDGEQHEAEKAVQRLEDECGLLKAALTEHLQSCS